MRYKNIIYSKFLFIIALVGCFLLGCENNSNNSSGEIRRDTSISIKAIDGLKFSTVRFEVYPGSRVSLTLKNTSDMDHNLLIVNPRSRKEVVKKAMNLGAKGPSNDYIPSSEDVLWHTSLLNPGDSDIIHFTTPETQGAYPYVCTFPGHGNTMYGVMYVTDKKKKLPSLLEDPNVPVYIKEENLKNKDEHPYKIKAPYFIRTFMPKSSPAAIAVMLPNQISYCWDAGSSRLRYAWVGGFLDSMDLWLRKGDEVAHVAGDIFYRDKTEYPFRIKDKNNIPQVKFKGFRLIDRYPEFHYQWNGIDVYELIKETENGKGIRCLFRIPKITEPIWYQNQHAGASRVESSTGEWEGDWLRITPEEAKEYSLIITAI